MSLTQLLLRVTLIAALAAACLAVDNVPPISPTRTRSRAAPAVTTPQCNPQDCRAECGSGCGGACERSASGAVACFCDC
ncbi:hypothetical protein C8J57DRAFT_1527708 [Mycena rebaudengoi]|nr:hypothetical protein C8J57DRAFT_1534420 [Mycena rebaudengoi]KAJ7240262.1 hypothetical protein C8J57DRAFT_1527708 [Mycena rebaudengoi]